MDDEIRLCIDSHKKSKVELVAHLTGNGIVVLLLGGEKPHVGAAVITAPRPSLSGESKTSCNSWIVPILGHKDDEVAKPAAEAIATATGQVTVVVAGLHVRDAEIQDISQIIVNCDQLVQEFIKRINRS